MKNYTPSQFWLVAASWGSYIRGGDPGACMYGFGESGRVQSEEHRRRCINWIDNHCLPGANQNNQKQLNKMKRYLLTAELAKE